MTVKEIIQDSEPVKDLELFCTQRPLAFERFIKLCGSYKNPKTNNAWVLVGTVIQKFGDFTMQLNNIEALKDFDLLSDWLVKNLERCRQEKINAGFEVPAR